MATNKTTSLTMDELKALLFKKKKWVFKNYMLGNIHLRVIQQVMKSNVDVKNAI